MRHSDGVSRIMIELLRILCTIYFVSVILTPVLYDIFFKNIKPVVSCEFVVCTRTGKCKGYYFDKTMIFIRIFLIFAFLVISDIHCHLEVETADDFVNLDADDNSEVIPFSVNARPFGIQPVQVEIGVAATLTDSKYDHFQKLTGQQHPHLSAVCSRRLTDGGWGYFPFPGSCNQYIHCDKDGNGFLETCAVGTFFNGQKCVKAEEVICPFDPCRRMPTGRQYSDGQTCFGYYKCLRSQSVSGICPSGFAFNAIRQGCLPDNTCIQPSGIMHPCFAGTTMPFPGQPHMFYLWDGRESVTAMECPRGLWYNPHVCSCDWVIPGETYTAKQGCAPMFHFGYSGNFLEEYNKAPQAPNTAVSIYKRSALFSKGGRIVIWMMNDIDMDSQWALCFEFMTQSNGGEVALVSNDWKKMSFTYKITHIPAKNLVVGYFRMKDGTIAELIVMGVKPNIPHFLRVAKLGSIMKMRVDNMPSATVSIGAGVASAPTPMVIGAAHGCKGFVGFFDELKFFRCVPHTFFEDYTGIM